MAYGAAISGNPGGARTERHPSRADAPAVFKSGAYARIVPLRTNV